jgi:hypothetical protein
VAVDQEMAGAGGGPHPDGGSAAAAAAAAAGKCASMGLVVSWCCPGVNGLVDEKFILPRIILLRWWGGTGGICNLIQPFVMPKDILVFEAVY